MTTSELLAMIDITADHGQPMPTLDDYTAALDAVRKMHEFDAEMADYREMQARLCSPRDAISNGWIEQQMRQAQGQAAQSQAEMNLRDALGMGGIGRRR